VLDEDGGILGRGITNSRSNYDLAADLARTEAFVSARFELLRREVEARAGAPALDRLLAAFRLEQRLAQLERLRERLRAESQGSAALLETVETLVGRIAAEEEERFEKGDETSRSDFFRDAAGSAYARIAEELARPPGAGEAPSADAKDEPWEIGTPDAVFSFAEPQAIPAEGVDAIKTFVVDCVLEAGGKTCPPTIVGVGIGGTADLCMHLAKVAATRPLGSHCEDPEGAKLERELTAAVNMLGVGPQGLGGDSTAFAVHVETAATHITMNPVAVNMQCHSARRARATFRPTGVEYGF